MSTHNICFHRERRKILCGYPLLSVAMMNVSHVRLNIWEIIVPIEAKSKVWGHLYLDTCLFSIIFQGKLC